MMLINIAKQMVPSKYGTLNDNSKMQIIGKLVVKIFVA